MVLLFKARSQDNTKIEENYLWSFEISSDFFDFVIDSNLVTVVAFIVLQSIKETLMKSSFYKPWMQYPYYVIENLKLKHYKFDSRFVSI